ncbi:hypothetical protein K488DRAFT_87477 [Vararia minispora EC-137]|uniref:Uncharacterized protein n=1 Tax=Vararia minispora EC-137 TaxID=1314806 RepID=A0ACB8QFY5_9AGAM|nr:hypothetical protein K488DRAFT_87477 [Vararia minispora EC-137]
MSAAMSSYTSSSSSSYNMPMYGSGSSMSSSSYDSCVQQCVAQFGQPSSMGMSSSSSSTTQGSSGTGATHTVIVAPTKGVLRYVPFAVNASVGDTVKFMWNAGPHTVTKSSALDVCNKTDAQAFASGAQNASFVFTQVVNDTNPIFYYCGIPGHCQKGMFGVINPGNAIAQPSSVDNMLGALAANNSATAASWAATKNITGAASSWGGGIDLSGMAGWAQNAMAENVLFTRAVMAANPSAIKNGQLDLGSIDLASLMTPPDVAALAASSTATTTNASSVAAPSSAAPAQTSAPTTNNATAKSGAGALTSPRAAVALVAVAAAFFAL